MFAIDFAHAFAKRPTTATPLMRPELFVRNAAWLVAGFLFALAAQGAAPVSAPAAGGQDAKPFLSGVTPVAVADWTASLSGEWNHWAYPANTKVEVPFHDLTFALNVPFEVTLPGGPAGVWIHAQFVWNEAEAAHFHTLAQRGTNVVLKSFGHGLYRLDHAALPEGMKSGTITDFTVQPDNRRRAHWPHYNPVRPVKGAPFPMGVALQQYNTMPPTFMPFGHAWRTDRLNAPFWLGDVGAESDPCEATATFSFPQAKPGWYAHWVALRLETDPGQVWFWPHKRINADDTLGGRFVIRIIVGPHDPQSGSLSAQVVRYLFKDPATKTNHLNVELFKRFEARTIELPVIFRRNGWVFDHVDVQPLGTNHAAWLARNQLATTPSDQNREAHVVTTTIKSIVNKTELKLRSASYFPQVVQPTQWRAQPQTDIVRHWELTFPEQIPDQGVSQLAVKIGAERKGDYSFDNPHYPFGMEQGIANRYLEGFIAPDVLVGANARVGGILPVPWTFAWQLVRADVTREAYLAGVSRYVNDPQGDWWRPVPAKPANGSVEIPYAAPAGRWTDFFNYTNAGARVVMALECGPWVVDGYYRRKSELERLGQLTVRDPGTRVVESDDDFSPWLVDFHKLRDETEEAAHVNGVLVGSLRQNITDNRRHWLKLMRLDLLTFPFDPDAGGDLVDQARTAVGHVTSAVARPSQRGRIAPVQPTAASYVLEDLKRERDELAKQINADLVRQSELIHQAVDGYDALISKARVKTVGCKEHKDHLKDLNRMIEHWEGERDLRRLKLYEASELFSAPELPKIIADVRFSGDATRELAKVLEARMALARARDLEFRLNQQILSPTPVLAGSPLKAQGAAARIAAMTSLREALAINPKSVPAQTQLRSLELEMTGWLAGKLQEEKQTSMATFSAYLDQRGYYDRQATNWWEGCKEWTAIMFGNGISTISAGSFIPGRTNEAAARAELTGDTQIKIARNQVSLLAIGRLLRLGQPLQQIRQLTPEKMGEVMVLRTAGGQPLPPAKAEALVKDIRDTFADMPDLQALAEGDATTFTEFLNKNYYRSFDPKKSGKETVADIFFSPGSLLLFLGPSAVVKVDGAWVGFTSSEIAVLGEVGKTQTARDLFTTTLTTGRLGELLLGKSPAEASWLARTVGKDAAFLASASGTEQFLTSGSRMAAAVLLYGGVAEFAHENDLPMLRALVDVIGALGAEELAYEMLSRHAGPVSKLVGKMDDFGRAIAAEERELAEIAKAARLIEEARMKLAAGANPNIVDWKEIEASLEKAASPTAAAAASVRPGTQKNLVPGLNRKDDTLKVLANAAAALRQGNTKEARAALDAAKQLQRELDIQIVGAKQALARARANLRRNPVLQHVSGPANSRIVADNPIPAAFIPKEYPRGNIGLYVRYGDEAVLKGKLDEALDLYRQADYLARGRAPAKDQLLIESRLGFIAEARSHSELLGILRRGETAAARPATAALSVTEAKSVVERIKSGELVIEANQNSSMNPVFFVRDATGAKDMKYVFKHIVDEEDLAGEIFGSLAARRLNLNAAGAQRASHTEFKVRRLIKEGNVEREVEETLRGVLVRAIEGQELWKLTEAEVLALKGEYAKLRVFRAWLGDTDGHLRNLFLDAEGGLFGIDFGFTHLMADASKHRHYAGMTAKTPEQFLAEAIEMPRIVLQNTRQSANEKHALYAWIGHMDEYLSYEEMAGTVKGIRELCDDRGGETLKEMLRESMKGMPENRVDEAFKVLKDRADELEDVLRWKFPGPRPGTALLFPGRPLPHFHAVPLFTNPDEELAFAA